MAKVGTTTGSVYLVLRSLEIRRPRKAHEKKLVEDGYRIAAPRHIAIIRRLGLSQRTVQRALFYLVEVGWIRVVRESGLTNVYLLGTRDEGYFVDQFLEPTLDTSDHPNPETLVTGDQGGGATDGQGTLDTSGQSILKIPVLKTQIEEEPRRTTWGSVAASAEKKLRVRSVEEFKGRTITHDEKRALQSAIAKKSHGRGHLYTSEEMVAAWRHRYFKAFKQEDPELRTKAQRTRAAKLFDRRAGEWTSKTPDMVRYVNYAFKRWSEAIVKDERFVPSGLPSLFFLLTSKGDRMPWLFSEWQKKVAQRKT